MANNHEFTLIPPNMVAEAEQSESSSRGAAGLSEQKKLVEFRVLLPDNTLYALQLPADCTGHDCSDQVCI